LLLFTAAHIVVTSQVVMLLLLILICILCSNCYFRGPSSPEIPEISKVSCWNCPEIFIIWQECPENGFWCAITCCSSLFCWLFLHHTVVVTVCIWQLQVTTTWILLMLTVL